MRSRRVQALRATLIALPILTIAVMILWPLRAHSASPSLLRVSFIDVGQGDAAWLSTPDGWDIVIDGGDESQGPGLTSYLQAHGVTDIEVLILSHPHADHVGGLVSILETMDVDQALTNCQTYSSTIYQTFLDLLTDKGVPTTCIRGGYTCAWGSHLSAAVVHPPEPPMSGTGSDVNNNSIVLRISYGSVDFLFTGDVESEGESAILEGGSILEAEVLKVAHHGSASSSSQAFLAEVDPQYAVISVGASNPYGHPAAETLQRLSDAGAFIHRTDEDRTIIATTDGITYSVRPETHILLPLVMKAWSATGADVRVNPDCSQFDAQGNRKEKGYPQRDSPALAVRQPSTISVSSTRWRTLPRYPARFASTPLSLGQGRRQSTLGQVALAALTTR